ncbi:MAG: discoidin domain-containing protein, partial [Abitibacteriaceae bacterium]|nr:discoidin domain-containing protein [Abditibacteriaceae bacterium]
SLFGPAQWRGGIAQGPDNYILSKSLPVEGGINRVLLRALPQAGKIVLTATSEGLKSAAIEIASHPVSITDGLSIALPNTGLTSYLGRGPTPPGDSITVTRKPVRIVNATAGASSDQAALSFDDNETTSWSNDGKLATGWIQYDLAQPALVSEITLKLGGWRTKSYPLRITVDGQEVFTGNTPQSLGYVTIPVKPMTGKQVKIELIGATVQRDAFGTIVELKNPANAATIGSAGNAKGTLNIIEAEVYEPVTQSQD